MGLDASVDGKDKKSVPWEPSASIINMSGLLFYHKSWAQMQWQLGEHGDWNPFTITHEKKYQVRVWE